MIERTRLISDIEQEIANLPDQFQEPLEATIVERAGKKVMAILPYRTYRALLETIESLEETLEIMKDPETVAARRQGIQEAERGETVAWEDVKKELEKANQGNEGAQD